jgi:cytoskeletal protein CcmA (bactofilin family)
MGYEGDTQEQDRQTGLSLLKAATGFGKSRPAEVTVQPVTPVPPPANTNTPVVAEPAPSPSVIAAGVRMTGSIEAADHLHIHGAFDGNVSAVSVVVRQGGSVKGDIIAETVDVHGAVEGRILGQTVHLHAGAVVRGEITHGALGVDVAAIFEGSVKRASKPVAETAKISA